MAAPNPKSAFTVQAVVLVVAAVVAGVILLTGQSSTDTQPPVKADIKENKTFDMLAYMDSKVGARESEKDVRCWSSLVDLQQFISQCKISPDAKSARTKLHSDHLESIWKAAAKAQGEGEYITKKTLLEILNKHYTSRETSQGVDFDFDADPTVIKLLIPAEAKDDYEKTIETWRLLQNWGNRHIDTEGRLTLKPQYDQQAIELMYRFLRSFDLAILRKTGEIAKADRLSEVDDASVEKSFAALRRQPD